MPQYKSGEDVRDLDRTAELAKRLRLELLRRVQRHKRRIEIRVRRRVERFDLWAEVRVRVDWQDVRRDETKAIGPEVVVPGERSLVFCIRLECAPCSVPTE